MKTAGCLKLRLAMVIQMVIGLVALSGSPASSATRVSIHVPSKSLSIMPYYFGKDKGFFARGADRPAIDRHGAAHRNRCFGGR